jgi:hypothetical protein
VLSLKIVHLLFFIIIFISFLVYGTLVHPGISVFKESLPVLLYHFSES